MRRLTPIAALFFAFTAVAAPSAASAKVTKSHALTLLDEPKYRPGFTHLDYVNPNAPKGGTVRRYAFGTFDTFNPFTIKGNPAAGLGFLYESLMQSTPDDMSSEYGLIAESVEVPDDLSYAIFNLRDSARFHDGKPITADDVVFTFKLLREKGAPHYRFYYANIAKAEKLGRLRVRFHFTGPPNRELPQITGQLPVLPKHYWQSRDFSRTTLEPPVASGPYRIADFEPGRFVEYERVRDYWGAGLAINRGRYNFDRVRFDFYRDQTVALEAFKAQQYDFRQENSSLMWAKGYDFPAAKMGLVKRKQVAHKRPSGMQAFVFNIRRPKFRDRRLRQALAYAFDFEWSNKKLFYGQYTRTKSYFANSELAARKPPTAAELKILEPLRGQIPDEAFSRVYEPPSTDGSGKIRRNLRNALRILRKAGWKVKDNALTDPRTGKSLEIEILLVSPQFERIVAPFVQNLKRLGVQARIRTVDQSQYINRLRAFDYDMIVGGWSQSESPGNEQRDFWSSSAAKREGSRNLIGIQDPAIDALIEKIVGARDRKSLVVATRALDRVLLWNHFVIPNWHVRFDRIAYWDKFGVPAKHPKYGVDFMSWWVDPAKQESIARGAKMLNDK